ncbi:MAG: hypothetical protein ACXAB7_18860, partial [Candidatus Kariarchaeaceae archaeon]
MVERYKLVCSGYFYIEEDATDLYFDFAGDGNLVFEFDYTSILVSGVANPRLYQESLGYYNSEGIDISGEQGNWKEFKISIDGNTTQNYYGGISVNYRYDDTPNRLVNAGVVSNTPNYISAYDVEAFDIRGQQNKDRASVYSFSVPLTSATHAQGFYYDNTNKYYLDQSGNILREGVLIQIQAGYKVDNDPTPRSVGTYENSYELLPRFKGFVNSITKDRDNEKLDVECFDFSEIPNSDVTKNYPDPSSYWNFGYFNRYLPKEPDGVNMPIAYDKWNLTNAVRDLFIKSGIPASIMYGPKYFQNSGYALLADKAVVDYGYQLDWHVDYSTDENINEYLYGGQYGDKVSDTAMEFIDTYGMNYKFNNEGYLELRPSNNPRYTFSDKTASTNMLRDPDFSSDENELYGVAVKNTVQYNNGTASMLIDDGVGYAVFNKVDLHSDPSNLINSDYWYYASFYAKNLSGSSASVRMHFWKKSGDGTWNQVSPVKWEIVPASTTVWTRYDSLFYGLNCDDAQLYIGSPNPFLSWPTWDDVYITDCQLETGALTAFNLPVRTTSI